MDQAKRERLEAKGYWIGDAADLLALNDTERKLVEYRVKLSIGIREARERAGLTQAALGKRIPTSQPQVARIEAGSRGVSFELMLKAFLAAGGDLDHLPSLGGPNQPTRKMKRTEAPTPKPKPSEIPSPIAEKAPPAPKKRPRRKPVEV